jgi:hypothetical protein
MLSEQVTQLLTAFVDGELSQQERETVLRLLNKSSEAREFLRQLQENAHKLKQLPPHKVEPSLVEAIMQAIAEQKAQPKQPVQPMVARRARRRWLPYTAAALAASLLVCALGLIYWKTMGDQSDTPKDEKNIAKNEVPDNKVVPQPQPTPTPTPTPRQPNPMLGKLVDGVYAGATRPVPVDPVFTASFGDLKNGKKDIRRELKPGTTVQLDITVKNDKLALDRLRDVLRDYKIKTVTDPTATNSLEAKAKVEYLVYAENLTADEVAKMMGDLSQSYVISNKGNQREVASPYSKVKAAPIAQDDKQRLAKVLGVKPDALEPKDVKPDPKRERQAVVLPTAAGASPSMEVAQFVNQRRPVATGTVQILIKIRQE